MAFFNVILTFNKREQQIFDIPVNKQTAASDVFVLEAIFRNLEASSMVKSPLKVVPSQKEFFKLVGALEEELPKISRRAGKVCVAEGRLTAGCFDFSVAVEQWFVERGYFARSKQGYFNGREYHWWTLVPVGRSEFIVDLTRDQFVTGTTAPRVQWFHPRSADAGDYADYEDE